MPDEQAVRDALRVVDDPEVGMNIVDLGLVYVVDVTEAVVRVALTMTTAACPMTDMIVAQARGVLEALVPVGMVVDIALVWDPPWSPQMMSPAAKEHFGWTT
jgi:metal-sulfur cluster biosynthetic enzyme